MYIAILLQGINSLRSEMCFIVFALFCFNFGLSVFCFVFFSFLHMLIIANISLMKAASIDGPFGLLVACSVFNVEMSYCEFVFRQIKMRAYAYFFLQSL